MPLERSTSKAATRRNFEELGKGRTYSKTKRKFGKKRADRQRVAIVLANRRKSKKRSTHKRHKSKR